MCNVDIESFNHVWSCEEARKRMKINIVENLEEWKGKDENKYKNWGNAIKDMLKGEPILEICIYAKEFEKIVREEKMSI